MLCLQEVPAGYPELPGNDGADQFAGIAQRLPGFSAVSGVAVDMPEASGNGESEGSASAGNRRRFGNMILSRYPVLQVLRHLLPWPAEPGTKSRQRMALEVTLDTPLGKARVTTTHLE